MDDESESYTERQRVTVDLGTEEKKVNVFLLLLLKEIWRIWIGEQRMTPLGFLRFIFVRKS